MHPLTCYAGQISLCHAKIEKISKKFFVMINKDGGGGQFLDFMGGTSCYEGGHRAHGGSPPVPSLGKTLYHYQTVASVRSLKYSLGCSTTGTDNIFTTYCY